MLDKLRFWENNTEGERMQLYIKATLNNGREVYLGPYKDQGKQILAHDILIDAARHGKLYDSRSVKLEDVSSDQKDIEIVDEIQLFNILAEEEKNRVS